LRVIVSPPELTFPNSRLADTSAPTFIRVLKTQNGWSQ